MNQIAISMKAGVIDPEGGSQELLLTEEQMIEVVKRIKEYAGVEG
jgi:hypothetical protein